MSEQLVVFDQGTRIAFSFADMLSFHGPGSPGGVAHAFKVLQRGLPLLGADGSLDRRALTIRTAFAGPGARDGFELVTRAVTDGRYFVEPALARPERGRALERFVFRLEHKRQRVTLLVREGYVTDVFIELARRANRTPAQERQLSRLKLEMAERVMSAAAEEVYDVADAAP